MIVLIDNYDSFVYNLARYVEELGHSATVIRNNACSVQDIQALDPSHIILSPGPCTPDEAGICLELIQRLGTEIPILGVCLGHQAIGQAYGGRVVRAKRPLHGKQSVIQHVGQGVFKGLPPSFQVARYHSLCVEVDSLPSELEVTATSSEGEIMGLQHKRHPVYGVQFHPESILTEHGYEMLQNFLSQP